MDCYCPLIIRNPDPHRIAGFYIQVPCGKCPACLSNKREQWSYRLANEQRVAKYCLFMTYTYDDDHLPILHKDSHDITFGLGRVNVKDNFSFVLIKEHLQGYLKLLRELLRRKDCQLRYYSIGEYGEHTYRPHYHALLFFDYTKFLPPNEIDDIVRKAWHFGNIKYGHVTPKSIRYVLKDMIKQQFKKSDYVKNCICNGCEDYAPFNLMSRRPGIGAAFYKAHEDFFVRSIQNIAGLVADGHYVAMPRYYKDKFFSQFQVKDEEGKVSLSLYGKTYKKQLSNKIKQKKDYEFERLKRHFGFKSDGEAYNYIIERKKEDEFQRTIRQNSRGGCL